MTSPVQTSSTETTIQGSALATNRNERYNPKGTYRKDKRLQCEHCKKPKHTKDMCQDIHGKPPDWKPQSQMRKNACMVEITTGVASEPVTAKQMEILRKLMTSSPVTNASKTVPSISTNSAVLTSHKGIFSLLSCKDSHDPWIVNNGASNHMTSSNTRFNNYQPCKKNVSITVVDESMCTATRRDMELNGQKLNSILHVPNL